MPQTIRSLYFENSIGCLWEEPGGYLRLDYKPSPREIVQFRALLTRAAQALSRHQWSGILVDQRQMSPFTPVEQAWMTTEWLPKAVHEHGYRHGAVLVAQNVIARLSMTQLVFGTRDLAHDYRTFNDEGAAVAWLASVSGR